MNQLLLKVRLDAPRLIHIFGVFLETQLMLDLQVESTLALEIEERWEMNLRARVRTTHQNCYFRLMLCRSSVYHYPYLYHYLSFLYLCCFEYRLSLTQMIPGSSLRSSLQGYSSTTSHGNRHHYESKFHLIVPVPKDNDQYPY